MRSARVQKLLRNIYIYSLLIMGIAISSIATYNLTAKVVNFNPSASSSFVYQEFIVQKGDTLWTIAESTNLDVDTRILVNSIMNYNAMNETIIRPGQVIYVPIGQSELSDHQSVAGSFSY